MEKNVVKLLLKNRVFKPKQKLNKIAQIKFVNFSFKTVQFD